ncbi:hypothetical protein LCGC14_0599550 [marine sediment metagenome]|uniref:Nudix hydrolase domain-containing protein n=1 Tax=marine sediment metagenome TaxID=412755 RepID=A0A0F9RB19_9ZZZZ
MKKQEYSMGLMFTKEMSQVLLIKKNHGPKSVIGRWNGIGGHLEDGETPQECQVREYEEETGVKTELSDWAQFTKLQGNDFIVHCFWGNKTYAVLHARTTTNEQVEIVNTNQHIFNIPLAPNLKWFIPFLMDRTTHNHLCIVLAKYLKDDTLDLYPTTTI